MRALVTGANGFLGRHVVEALLGAGVDVIATVRSRSRSGGLEGRDHLEVREADLRVHALDDLLVDVDVVIHLAAQVTGSDEARFASTVVGTERLLGAVGRSSVRRLVVVSSYSVYDWERAHEVLDESSPTEEAPYRRDGYTVAKVWQERLVREFEGSTAVEVVVLRPGFIWGVGTEDLAGAGIRLGPLLLVVGPRMRLPLTFVENCADAVVAAARVPAAAGHTFNIVDGPGPSAWRYARLLLGLDRSIRIRVPLPYRWGRAFVVSLGTVMPRLYRAGGKLPGVLVLPSFTARFRPLLHAATPASRVLGWEPRVTFEEARRRSLTASTSAG